MGCLVHYKAGVCSEIIGQCDVEHIMTSSIKTIMPVLKISTYIITECPIGLAAIIVTMSVSTFKTAIILYLFQQYVSHLIVGQ